MLMDTTTSTCHSSILKGGNGENSKSSRETLGNEVFDCDENEIPNTVVAEDEETVVLD